MPSTTNFASVGVSGQPAPSVWADCPNTLLNDLGLGHFVNESFIGDTATLPGLPNDGDSPTYAYDATNGNRVLRVTTGATDNNAAAVFTRPLGTVTRRGGSKLWFETEIALGAVADQGVFVGVAELAALDRDVVADDAGALDTESLIGFQILATDTDAVDVVYRKDAGTTVEVATDVTNSVAIPAEERAAVTANTFVRLGLRFDGRDTLRFYVNGYEVAAVDVDATVDQAKEYGGIAAIKTGAAAARVLDVNYFRAASQVRA